jgi:hypothetical protein
VSRSTRGGVSGGGEVGAAAGREVVADLVALGEAELLELADVGLEGEGFPAELPGELAGGDPGVGFDESESPRGPPGPGIELGELLPDEVDVERGEVGLEGEVDVVGFARVVKLDAPDEGGVAEGSCAGAVRRWARRASRSGKPARWASASVMEETGMRSMASQARTPMGWQR